MSRGAWTSASEFDILILVSMITLVIVFRCLCPLLSSQCQCLMTGFIGSADRIIKNIQAHEERQTTGKM